MEEKTNVPEQKIFSEIRDDEKGKEFFPSHFMNGNATQTTEMTGISSAQDMNGWAIGYNDTYSGMTNADNKYMLLSGQSQTENIQKNKEKTISGQNRENNSKENPAIKEAAEKNYSSEPAENTALNIAEGMLRAIKSGKNEITLRLDPDELGGVSIKIFEEDKMTKARLIVETQKAKRIIQQHFNLLRKLLVTQDIKISIFEVIIARQYVTKVGAISD